VSLNNGCAGVVDAFLLLGLALSVTHIMDMVEIEINLFHVEEWG
jgi:hypothetical protein